jgi:glycosyltransferase involved in cell wall biosynthesis
MALIASGRDGRSGQHGRSGWDGRPGWDGLLVLCATTEYGGIRMGDWHLARHLARLAPLLFVDPPMSPLTPLRRNGAGGAMHGPKLTTVGPGLARLTPVVQPFPFRPGTTTLTSFLVRRYLRWATARLGGKVLAVICGWPQYPVFGSCGEQFKVYWAKDDFVGGAALLGLNAGLVDKQERRIAAASDLIVAASPVVASTWRERGHDPVLIPFGADVDAYRDVDAAIPPAGIRLPGPVAGFVGRINDRIDLSLLETIADRGRSLLLVGPKDPAFEPERFGALCRRPHVRWVGPQPAATLPGYLKLIDVGLVPYRDTPFNRGSFPLKILEYLAAGRAVVGTDLPAIRWLATDLVCMASGRAEFAEATDRLAKRPRTAADVARRREFAEQHSWARRAADMRAVIAARCQPGQSGPMPPSR